MGGLREYLLLLEESGELERVAEPVDWNREIGERTRGAAAGGRRPALLFENVAGCPGWRVVTNGLASHGKIALALGLAPSATFEECVTAFRAGLSSPLAPVSGVRGDFEENLAAGAGIDLTALPVPWWHASDGGRYIGTWHINASRDPATGIGNVGVYRMQLLGPRTTAVSVSPHSHLARQLAAAEKTGTSVEMAAAIGVAETAVMAAAAGLPYGADEYRLAGGLAREPVRLAPCRTVDIQVPADAEIVLEGTIDPRQRVLEGPFLDYAGIPKVDRHGYRFEVRALAWRHRPIFRGAAVGIAGGEDHLLFALLSAARCLDFHGSRLRQAVQNALLRRESYRLFQAVGRLRSVLGGAAG